VKAENINIHSRQKSWAFPALKTVLGELNLYGSKGVHSFPELHSVGGLDNRLCPDAQSFPVLHTVYTPIDTVMYNMPNIRIFGRSYYEDPESEYYTDEVQEMY
jgi:hypothetical protein